jgi:hypothetical protein
MTGRCASTIRPGTLPLEVILIGSIAATAPLLKFINALLES